MHTKAGSQMTRWYRGYNSEKDMVQVYCKECGVVYQLGIVIGLKECAICLLNKRMSSLVPVPGVNYEVE